MEDWQYVKTFKDVVNEKHIDPGAAFECLSVAKASGKDVRQEVCDVLAESGISEADTATGTRINQRFG